MSDSPEAAATGALDLFSDVSQSAPFLPLSPSCPSDSFAIC